MGVGFDQCRIKGFFQHPNLSCKYGGCLYGNRKNKCLLWFKKLELVKQVISTEMSKEVQNSLFENPNLYGDLMSNAMRATFGELVEGHIGLELANIFFQRLK